MEHEKNIATDSPLSAPTKEKNPEVEKRGFFETIARFRKADKIVKDHGNRRNALMHILQDVQQEYNYLPEDILDRISYKLDIPLSYVFSTASFYDSFHFEPRGEHIISVCMGTACHVRGAQRILESFENQLNIGEGETTDDLKFTLERVNCLGACALGPIVVHDGKYHGNLDTQKARKIIND